MNLTSTYQFNQLKMANDPNMINKSCDSSNIGQVNVNVSTSSSHISPEIKPRFERKIHKLRRSFKIEDTNSTNRSKLIAGIISKDYVNPNNLCQLYTNAPKPNQKPNFYDAEKVHREHTPSPTEYIENKNNNTGNLPKDEYANIFIYENFNEMSEDEFQTLSAIQKSPPSKKLSISPHISKIIKILKNPHIYKEEPFNQSDAIEKSTNPENIYSPVGKTTSIIVSSDIDSLSENEIFNFWNNFIDLDYLSVDLIGSSLIQQLDYCLNITSGIPKTFWNSLKRHSSTEYKTIAYIEIDKSGAPVRFITYEKLFIHIKQVIYFLTRTKKDKQAILCNGMTVPLIFDENSCYQYIVAFYACLSIGAIPVTCDVYSENSSDKINLCEVNHSNVILTSKPFYEKLKMRKDYYSSLIKSNLLKENVWILIDNQMEGTYPKNFSCEPIFTDEKIAYIEYYYNDYEPLCVVNTFENVRKHVEAVSVACEYREAEIVVSTLDFTKTFGLWHSVLCGIWNGCQIIQLTFKMLKKNPSLWLKCISTHKCAVFLTTVSIINQLMVHEISLQCTTSQNNKLKSINLSSLRKVIIVDCDGPWVIVDIEKFEKTFEKYSLAKNITCQTSGSTSCNTISIRRSFQSSESIKINIRHLAYNIISENCDNDEYSLKINDCGEILPNSQCCVIRRNEIQSKKLEYCFSDEVGEICVNSDFMPSVITQNWPISSIDNAVTTNTKLSRRVSEMGIFKSKSVKNSSTNPTLFRQSSLLGFFSKKSMVYIVGKIDETLFIDNKFINFRDIINSILNVDSNSVVYKNRVVVFSLQILHEKHPIIIAEKCDTVNFEMAYRWLHKVISVISRLHKISIFCAGFVEKSIMPKPFNNKRCIAILKDMIENSELSILAQVINPIRINSKLPLPYPKQKDCIGPIGKHVGQIIRNDKLAYIAGRTLNAELPSDDIISLLRNNAVSHPDYIIMTIVKSKENLAISCLTLWKRCEKLAAGVHDKLGHLKSSSKVAIILYSHLDVVVHFYACIMNGFVPVLICPPKVYSIHSLHTIYNIVSVTKCQAILTNYQISSFLKSKNYPNNTKSLPKIYKIRSLNHKFVIRDYSKCSENVVFIQAYVTPDSEIEYSQMTYKSILNICNAIRLHCEAYLNKTTLLCFDIHHSFCMIMLVFMAVYSKQSNIIIPPSELEYNPALWLQCLTKYKIQNTYIDFNVMNVTFNFLINTDCNILPSSYGSKSCIIKKFADFDFSNLRNVSIVLKYRSVTNKFCKITCLLSKYGWTPNIITNVFSCQCNYAICLKNPYLYFPNEIYISAQSLRNRRIQIVNKDSDCISIKMYAVPSLLPGVELIIVDPDTNTQCSECQFGEIWLRSEFGATVLCSINDGESCLSAAESFANEQRVIAGSPDILNKCWSRSGIYGFTHTIQNDFNNTNVTCLYILGSLSEQLYYNRHYYYHVDIEDSIVQCADGINDACILAYEDQLLVIVEYNGLMEYILNCVIKISIKLIEDNYITPSIIMFVEPQCIPRNSRGDKQRPLLKKMIEEDSSCCRPIYTQIFRNIA
ncbi:hypothetical protein A3Q56_01953 [Intoshia linei]|uniref:DMAP1-binding domain-containing protein n=1 Tax=Intoshia linei TaxID=1819745 RepID=A0A177B7R2_9BILA|nr:hypothetical protein A3Q56_01953 [Intoshia linei]